jgi:hypothetical protein
LNGTSIDAGHGVVSVGVSSTNFCCSGNPYRAGYGVGSDVRTQLIYTASELQAAGMVAGNITDVTFNLVTSVSGVLSNFKISIGSTSTTSFGTSFLTSPMTQVVNLASYTPVLGLNTHTFSTPFYWDGTSSIVINVCQTNSTSGTTYVDAYTSANTGVLYTAGAGLCTSTTGTTLSTKPIVKFGAITGVNNTNSYTFNWNPGYSNSKHNNCLYAYSNQPRKQLFFNCYCERNR